MVPDPGIPSFTSKFFAVHPGLGRFLQGFPIGIRSSKTPPFPRGRKPPETPDRDDFSNGRSREWNLGFRERENSGRFLPGCPLIFEESLIWCRDQNRKTASLSKRVRNDSTPSPEIPRTGVHRVSLERCPLESLRRPDFFGGNDGKRGRMILFETHA